MTEAPQFDAEAARIAYYMKQAAGLTRQSAGVRPWLNMFQTQFNRSPVHDLGTGHSDDGPRLRHPDESFLMDTYDGQHGS